MVALCGLLSAVLLAGLGAWQLERLAWKQDLLARVERARHGEAMPAPGPPRWPELQPGHDEYRRVAVRGRFEHERATRVRAVTVLGSGYWLLTPLLTDEGWWLLVNRGFVPPRQPTADPVPIDEPEGEQRVVGLLRFSEAGGSLLQSNQPSEDRWYSRDITAIATARGLDAPGAPPHPVAPYFIDEVAPAGMGAASGGWPRPGLTVLDFRNNHLGYALTWFALAAMALAAAGFVLRHEWRLRSPLARASR